MNIRPPILPSAANSITKGTPLKYLLNSETISCLAENILFVQRDFPAEQFCYSALEGLEDLELMQRGKHLAHALRKYLPDNYAAAIDILLKSFTPEQQEGDSVGLAVFFYLPHSFFIADFGQDIEYNAGKDPFATSMLAMYQLTRRFTAEFAIRPFLIAQQQRTLEQLQSWITDANPHIRRWCSEGTRPKLPWGKRIPALIADPRPTLPILQALKNDPSLYVRRSVANHLGDIAKDHRQMVYDICLNWLQEGASSELKWVIRHALRHPAKKGDAKAQQIRAVAK